jgi:hypothetical protein
MMARLKPVSIAPFVLALGAVGVSATQYRLASLPVGVGELSLVLAATVALYSAREGQVNSVSRLILASVAFGGALSTVFLGSLALNWAETEHMRADQIRELIALGLCAVSALALLLLARAPAVIQKFGFAAVVLATVGQLLHAGLFAGGVLSLRFSPVYGERWRGWAVNPNQLALLLVCLPYFLLVGRREVRAAWRGMATIALGVLIVVTGVLTGSDALVIAWCAGGLLLLTPPAYALLRDSRLVRFSAAFLAIGAFALSFVFTAEITEATQLAFASLAGKEGGQGQARIDLWRSAARVLWVAPVLGRGPGAQSGFEYAGDGIEAHNTFLDLGASTGLLGIGVVSAGLVAAIRYSYQCKSLVALAGLTSIGVFSLFHYTLRQPILWLLVVMMLAHAAQQRDKVT